MKVPQLLGMGSPPDSARPGQPPKSVISSEPPSPSCTCISRVVLGFNWDYPVAPTQPPTGISLKFWTKDKYDGRPVKDTKGGQHGRRDNVGQDWIEDESGSMISGIVAKNLRDMLSSLLHSLVWSGQAGEKSAKLPHEARVYIHVVLARHFPFLLLCDDGKWKINELIVQMYSTFASTHIKPSKSKKRQELPSSSRKRPYPDSIDLPTLLDEPTTKTARTDTVGTFTDPSQSSSLSALALFTITDPVRSPNISDISHLTSVALIPNESTGNPQSEPSISSAAPVSVPNAVPNHSPSIPTTTTSSANVTALSPLSLTTVPTITHAATVENNIEPSEQPQADPVSPLLYTHPTHIHR